MEIRIKKELKILANDPGPGISAWPVDDNLKILEAQIQGPTDSPFEGGLYNLTIQIPERYPFDPPLVRFVTPIYHPNIDGDGRICLDLLKMQPQGSWSPSVNINTLLLTIRMLMESPNGEDGLVAEITEEFNRDRGVWMRKAKEHALKHAMTAVPAAIAPSATADTDASSATPAASVSVSSHLSPAAGVQEGVRQSQADTSKHHDTKSDGESEGSSDSGSESNSDSDGSDYDSDDSGSAVDPKKNVGIFLHAGSKRAPSTTMQQAGVKRPR